MDCLRDDRSLWLANHVLPHEPALRKWLGRLAGLGPDRVDDLVQETYAVLATCADVTGIQNPRAYAFQVARSILLQDLRRSRVVPIGSFADLDRLASVADEPTPEQYALGRDELTRVADAIAAMPAQTRRAFHLRRVEGLSQREVAAAMKLSENTVEKHIMRGIRMLMQQFGRGGKACSDASMHCERGSVSAVKTSRARRDY
ncbi:RNA polymerase sigma-70 factor (ECF subfamily) [Sphingomonas vulcanisoli]|uniref:RNA polymerase sigma-70 factor (ECF subfamily) n=1 Tax=Sphingomonas vulcanisoli TaxID=1658060 RepID=A0ABX0TSP2_9SPHN|nr:sigma-70 family RNA polymerase sigma factor [Sphingomonas vulcanisoli]NIJ08481.1 RNA polymerase sigma-70 factor (ECF subfamily) [Sphingomonas vulcanisoli]